MQILSLSSCYSEHMVLMLCFELLLSMALNYCIIPLVLGVGSFSFLVVEAYMSFYLLKYISHVLWVIWVHKKRFKLLFLGFGGQGQRKQ